MLAIIHLLKTNHMNELPDELNPIYLFSTTATTLLVQIVTNQIDAKQLAEEELQRRGLNHDGSWIGFSKKL
jgi:aromatic ring-opening dioxygenase catalytic subunit (LigB family)